MNHAYIFSALYSSVNSIFSVVDRIYKILINDEAFFLFATITK